MEDEGNDQFQTHREQYRAIYEQMKRIEQTLALLEKEKRKSGDKIRQQLLKLSNPSSRSNSGGQDFCIAYFQSRDRYHFFSSSTHSLRLVYLVALCFRSLLKGDGDIHGTLLCLLPGKNVYTSIVEVGVTKMKL
jgi:hypothetical protein